MSWISIGDWADEMSTKLEQQRRERLKVAARHFGLDVLDVLRDKELEEQLLTRYEALACPGPVVEEPEDE